MKRRRVVSGEFTLRENHLWLALRLDHVLIYNNERGGDLDHPDTLVEEGATHLLDAIDPDVGEKAHNNAGNLMDRDGMLDKAVDQYSAAMRTNPRDAVPHFNLGLVLAVQDKLDQAIFQFREAIRLDPDNPESRIKLGTLLRDQGKMDEAIQEFRTAVSIDSGDANAHDVLGDALADRGDLTEPINEFDAAIRIDPNSAFAHNMRPCGRAFCERGRDSEMVGCKGNPPYDSRFGLCRARSMASRRTAFMRVRWPGPWDSK